MHYLHALKVLADQLPAMHPSVRLAFLAIRCLARKQHKEDGATLSYLKQLRDQHLANSRARQAASHAEQTARSVGFIEGRPDVQAGRAHDVLRHWDQAEGRAHDVWRHWEQAGDQ